MSYSAQHRVDMFNLVCERKSVGKSSWEETMHFGNLFHNDALTFIQIRDAVAAIVKASAWYKRVMGDVEHDQHDDLHLCVDNIADSPDVEDFDHQMHALYDLADWARVWIESGSSSPPPLIPKLFAWKRLSDGAIVQQSYPTKGELFEAAGFGAVRVDEPIKGSLAVEVVERGGKLVEANPPAPTPEPATTPEKPKNRAKKASK